MSNNVTANRRLAILFLKAVLLVTVNWLPSPRSREPVMPVPANRWLAILSLKAVMPVPAIIAEKPE
ncbi:MAG: hypothetical protein RH862_00725 [Leptospiraceae bacterium]